LHKEILFAKWDSRLKEVEQEMEEAAPAAKSIIKCVNENLHNANLVTETTPGFLPYVKQL